MKLFTLDERLILRKAGALTAADRGAVQRALGLLLPAAIAANQTNLPLAKCSGAVLLLPSSES